MTTTQLLAREGVRGGIILFICFCCAFIFSFKIFSFLLLVILLFWIFIFRNPERLPSEYIENMLLSPCDGRIENIEYVNDSIILTFKIGITDVGILRSPLNIKELSNQYRIHGLKLFCFEDNFREKINSNFFLENNKIALQIIPEIFDAKLYSLDTLKIGERMGFCKMGILRMKILLNTVELKINIGDIVRGGETILGYVK